MNVDNNGNIRLIFQHFFSSCIWSTSVDLSLVISGLVSTIFKNI